MPRCSSSGKSLCVYQPYACWFYSSCFAVLNARSACRDLIIASSTDVHPGRLATLFTSCECTAPLTTRSFQSQQSTSVRTTIPNADRHGIDRVFHSVILSFLCIVWFVLFFVLCFLCTVPFSAGISTVPSSERIHMMMWSSGTFDVIKWCTTHRWLMMAIIICNSSFVPLLKGLRRSNPCKFESRLSFLSFCRNRTDDLGINSPALWPIELVFIISDEDHCVCVPQIQSVNDLFFDKILETDCPLSQNEKR